MVRKFEQYSPKESSDIIGLPSGTVVRVRTLSALNKLIDENMILYIKDWGENEISSYCFDDRNYEYILNILEDVDE